MLVKPILPDEDIIESLKNYFDIQVDTLRFLPLGADPKASIFRAEAHDKSSYFVKLKQGHQDDRGIAVVNLLHNAGVKQIIYPIKSKQNQFTQSINNFTLMVYPFIEGQNGFLRDLTTEQWIVLGKTLKQLHKVNVPSTVQQQIRHETYSSKWREIVRSLYPIFEADPIGDEIAQQLSLFIKQHLPVIRRLVDRAEQLAQVLQSESPKFVLCHSDIHAGNVLIAENNAIYIVDWDEPIMAPKERDLMFIGGGVANIWNKLYEEALFYEGYGKTEINRTILAYYRHERIVEDIAIYAQDLLLTTAGGEDRAEMYKHFVAMFEPRGVVEIAFETDEGFGG